ncbi:MAG TPA: hypothetical protein VFF28_01015 [Candidatus Nanoarchaeia archaeon]|nr:hypothetical protein [Candidatus Nanoarchaeia archaeon]
MASQMILFDILSFSCMNCRRSLQHILKLDARYRGLGLRTILLHPPEWRFEDKKELVLGFLKKNKINLPLVMDKDKKKIARLGIDFWPAQVLLLKGRIIYKHIGEGKYSQLEDAIRRALKAKREKIFKKEPRFTRYPCIYFGKNKGSGKYLAEGKWKASEEAIEGYGIINLVTRGKKIYIVAEANKNPNRRGIFSVVNTLNVESHNNNPVTQVSGVFTTNKPSAALVRGNGARISTPGLYLVKTFRSDKKRKFKLNVKKPVKLYSLAAE